jgi:hypothetical protein
VTGWIVTYILRVLEENKLENYVGICFKQIFICFKTTSMLKKLRNSCLADRIRDIVDPSLDAVNAIGLRTFELRFRSV